MSVPQTVGGKSRSSVPMGLVTVMASLTPPHTPELTKYIYMEDGYQLGLLLLEI